MVDFKGRALGTAHYSSTSQIALRLLSQHVELVDESFIFERLKGALQFRERVVADSNAYRLIHAEGDLLPGLIVDRYADWLVVQLLDQGMDSLAGEITGALNRLLQPLGIVARNDVPVRTKESLPLETKVLAGETPTPVKYK